MNATVGENGVSVDRSTTVDDARTGQSHTFDSGLDGNDRYAGADGQVYHNDGGGWQNASGGSLSGDSAWADREQSARDAGSNRVSGLQAGGWSGGGMDRMGGAGDWGSRSMGGGFGDRFGEGGGFGGGRSGGGGFRGRR